MSIDVRSSVQCFHGGASFEAIGSGFEHLDYVDKVINADVLDAWFPPAPAVIEALSERLEWITRTSPPTDSQGLTSAISRSRQVPAAAVLPGAGSSSLIFTALLHRIKARSRALLLDPTYGEYAHILEQVIGCRVDRFLLHQENGFKADLEQLTAKMNLGYDLVVLVNPNNPTGQHISRQDLEALLPRISKETLVWVDEAYIDFVNSEESIEGFAASSANVVVCKSMSKAYALSGLRVGYLCGPPRIISEWRRLTPPWAVSLPGQLATITALGETDYYRKMYAETHGLRQELAEALNRISGMKTLSGSANYLFCTLPQSGPTTQVVLERCRQHDLYLRDPAATAMRLGSRSLRIAVKDLATNQRIVEILKSAIEM